MTADVTASEPFAAVGPLLGLSRRRVSIGFLNWAHALDHFVMLVFPTVVIGLQAVYGRTYSELIGLSTASFIAFGLFSLPAGWLADRWSRRNMMVAFYLGCGASLDRRGVGAVAGRARRRAVRARHVCRDLSSGRHRDGDRERDPSRPHAGVQRRLRQSRCLARRRHHRNPDRRLVVARRIPRAGHGLHRDRHRLCRGSFPTKSSTSPRAVRRAEVPLSAAVAATIFGLFIVVALTRRTGVQHAVGRAAEDRRRARRAAFRWSRSAALATAVFICGAIAQIAVGRLVERFPPHILFAVLALMQFVGVVWAAYASGVMLLVALAFTMAAIYGQITVNDLVIARYTADAWRGRVYAVRYFLTFMISGVAVSMIAFLYGRGGFPTRARHDRLRGARLSDRGGGHRLYRRQRGSDRVPHAMPAE